MHDNNLTIEDVDHSTRSMSSKFSSCLSKSSLSTNSSSTTLSSSSSSSSSSSLRTSSGHLSSTSLPYDSKPLMSKTMGNNGVQGKLGKGNGKRCHGFNVGVCCLLLVSLLVLVIWGKVCAIFCTSAMLVFVNQLITSIKQGPSKNIAVDHRIPEIGSKQYKKKIIMEGYTFGHRHQVVRQGDDILRVCCGSSDFESSILVAPHKLDDLHRIDLWRPNTNWLLACDSNYMPGFRIHGTPYLLGEKARRHCPHMSRLRRAPLNPRGGKEASSSAPTQERPQRPQHCRPHHTPFSITALLWLDCWSSLLNQDRKKFQLFAFSPSVIANAIGRILQLPSYATANNNRWIYLPSIKKLKHSAPTEQVIVVLCETRFKICYAIWYVPL
ncbi:hypothetical protein Goshw_005019 [Gossypium schwendimanii]|uniref:Uncharacterized protein n=1 Tax=Gossypium schwendimanii TaxID=34291 RepID=A0A7J9KQD8_GOSSC|nr:hypothetical protein [Gossypium schwendimanii]